MQKFNSERLVKSSTEKKPVILVALVRTIKSLALPLFFVGLFVATNFGGLFVLGYLALVYFGMTYKSQLDKLEEEDRIHDKFNS